jgi:hypothetical protein
MEMNPNHPATQMLHDEWHTICAVLLAKLGGSIVLSMDDVRLLKPGQAIVFQELDDGIHLNIVEMDEANRLVQREGGKLI